MSDNVEIPVQTNMFKDVLLNGNSSIKMALEVINQHTARIALILNGDGVLIGTITDGDVRRGILNGVGVDESVVKIMNTAPRTVSSSASRKEILRIMKKKKLFQIPVVDEKMRPVRIELFQELLSPRKQDNIVVLMAGGLGTRLGS
ncbi:MAG: CBS domain-containing protein, partial [Alphaproteobacteria bacterium]|nr:CBS domain-containing protein [Alphaproteobacteria bacterium]